MNKSAALMAPFRIVASAGRGFHHERQENEIVTHNVEDTSASAGTRKRNLDTFWILVGRIDPWWPRSVSRKHGASPGTLLDRIADRRSVRHEQDET